MNIHNVDNVGIEIDDDVARNENNKRLCQYLKDAKAYNEYLQPVLEQQVNAGLQSVKHMFLPKNNKEGLKVF